MKRDLGDVNARARGLATHLLPAEERVRLAHAPGCGALARELAARGLELPETQAGPLVVQVERALRAAAEKRLGLLARWLASRVEAFRVIFEEPVRRSLRVLLRTAGQGLPPELRQAGLLGSPLLPAEELEALSASDGVEDLVRRLAHRRNPYAVPLQQVLRSGSRDLFALEIALERAFHERALRAAERFGADLADFVREGIDLENAWSALVLDEASLERAGEVFLTGGRLLSRSAFDAACSQSQLAARRAVLARALRQSPLRELFTPGPEEEGLADLERRALRIRIEAQSHRARVDPLGPAPLLGYALSLLAELHDLRRLAFGLDLGAPAATLVRELVAAA